LLADKQWGSAGVIDYRTAALNMINEIMQYDVNQSEWTLKLGDWAKSGSEAKYTRSSDFMLNHLRAFQEATGDERWQSVIDKTYQVIATVHMAHSAATGLMPDFIIKLNGVYQPAREEDDIENGEDDSYHAYNSSRTPWRLATDYLVSGADEQTAFSQLNTLNAWIQSTVIGNQKPDETIKAGYYLHGASLPGSSYASMAFIAPFGVSGMINAGNNNQIWINQIWTYLSTTNYDDKYFLYYQDSIRLLSMIVMSGNWWTPLSPDPTH